MSASLFNKFRADMPLRLIKASWLNRVANLWNYMRGGRCINVTVPDNPSPESGVRVDLDMKALEDELARRGFAKQSDLTVDVLAARTTLPQDEVAPEDWDKDDGTGEGEEHSTTTNGVTIRFYPAAGSSKKAARADHKHKSNLVPLENSTAANRPQALANYETVEGVLTSTGVIGTSKYAARADHKHPKPLATQLGGLTASKWLKSGSDGKITTTNDVPAVLTAQSAGLLFASGTTLSFRTIGTGAGQVAAGDHTHDASEISNLPTGLLLATSGGNNGLNGAANTAARSDHSHDIGNMKCTISGHSGNCFLVVGNDGSITHSTNYTYNQLTGLLMPHDGNGNATHTRKTGWVNMTYCVKMEKPVSDPTDGEYLTVYTVERYYHSGLLTTSMQNGKRFHPVDGASNVAVANLPSL